MSHWCQFKPWRKMPLAANGNPNSTNGVPFIRNVFIFLWNEKAFLINGNPNSTNGYPFVSIEFSFLCNANPLPINGNSNSMKDIPKSMMSGSCSLKR